MKDILIVEDEKNLLQSLTDYLRYEGFLVRGASTLAEARRAVESPPDLVLLDWMLPDGQGIDLVKEWRPPEGTPAPWKIVVLTARVDLVDKVLALEGGADDYVTKPFQARELLARIHVQLRSRETRKSPDVALEHGGIRLCHATRRVTLRGSLVSLKRMEYKLLKWFLENPGRVFTRDEVLNQVWGYECYPTTRTVDTHVLQLRQKLGENFFETVRGVGYRFRADGTPAFFSPAADNSRVASRHDEGH